MSDLASQPPLRLFYSYSHKDETLRQRLETHLKLLQRQNVIVGWHDRVIEAGQEWVPEIKKRLDEADIILLLVSTDFLASDYCWGVEMQQALQRHQAGATRVIPIILRPTDLTGAPFMHLQCLPRDAKAVITWAIEDEAWTQVAQGIRQVAMTLRQGRGAGGQAPAPIVAGRPVGSVPQVPAYSRASLREFLMNVLVGDSDLEAFCLDYYPRIKQLFSGGMDRITKVNLLIERENADEILRRLLQSQADRYQRFKHLLKSDD